MDTDQTTAGRRRGLHYGMIVVLLCTVINATTLGFGRFAYTLVLPSMKEALGLNYTETGLLAAGNVAGYMVGSLVIGVLTARYGVRLVSSVWLAFAGLAMALTGLSGSFLTAMVPRTAVGLGSGGSNVPGLGLISSWFAPRRRGVATGIVVGGAGVGMVVVGYLIPPLILNLKSEGWRASWYIMGTVTIVASVVTYLFLRDNPSEKGIRPFGAETSNAGLATVSSTAYRLADVYRLPALWHLGLVQATWGFSYMAYTTFFAAYLIGERGVDALYVGAVWSAVGVLSIFSGIFWGAASDSKGRKPTIIMILTCQAVSYGLLAIQSGQEVVIASGLLFGISSWAVPGVMSATVGDIVGSKMAPAGVGFVWLLYSAGQVLGPGVGGYVGDITHSFVATLELAAGVGFAGALGMVFMAMPKARN